jgi:hypothetical protein
MTFFFHFVAASRCLDVSINSTQVQKKQKIKTRFSRSAKISHRSKLKKSGNMRFQTTSAFWFCFTIRNFLPGTTVWSSKAVLFLPHFSNRAGNPASS